MKSSDAVQLNEYKLQLLRQLSNCPWKFVDFTRKSIAYQMSPVHIKQRLDELLAEGLISIRKEVYSITPAGESAVIANARKADASTFPITNATTVGKLKMCEVWKVPQRKDDNRNYKSFGVGC